MAPSSSSQTKPCSNLSGKLRVIARIRGFRDEELAVDSKHVISIRKSDDGGPSEKFVLSFDDQSSSRKNEYEVDHCYQQNEDTALLFSKEIKPYISRVFDGENSTFIAFGARGSGKTYTIQGSEEKVGLGMLVMNEILKIVEGGRHAVVVSMYEVYQDHVYDLLDSKNPEVQVLEDGHGEVILKGLSKVPVKSMLEFQKLYNNGSSSNKPTQKITLELPRRSHKALMIHVLACDASGNSKCVGKMNLVDLAGYENVRRNTSDGTNTRINKSLNALLNVIHAINANERRVPYRESKLSRVLQDSLGGTNRISILVCLNPLFCLDTIHTVTLASRLKNIKPVAVCSVGKKQTTSHAPLSTNKANCDAVVCSAAKKLINSHVPPSASKADSVVALNSTAKKQASTALPLSALKPKNVLKGRNLFGGKEQASVLKEQVLSMENDPSIIADADISDDDSTMVPYVEEEKCSSGSTISYSDVVDIASAIIPCPHEEDALVKTQSNSTELIPHEGDSIEKENNSLVVNEGELTVKLRELTDNLRSLSSSTPLSISRPQDANIGVAHFVDAMEPKTPLVTHKMGFSNCPSGTFSKPSSRVKESLVQDYLQFLNTASKEDLKGIRGIGEKRATYILELREESPQPFKSLDDLQEIGLSAKQVKNMMKNAVVELFG